MITPNYLGYEPPDFTHESTQTGMWCRIVVEPDTFTGERFNIGVGIVDNTGKRMAKVITEKGRLECVFGTNDAESILMMAELARKCFETGSTPLFENVIFGEAMPLLNQAPTTALQELFVDQVTFALPQRSETTKPNGWLTREQTRDKVYQIIRDRVSPSQAQSLIPATPIIKVAGIVGSAKAVKIPLQPFGGAAGLESACYSPATVKTHLLDAMLDIQTHASTMQLQRVGMFVLRPITGLSKKSLQNLDNAIDDVLWRAPKAWRIEIEGNTDCLTDKILDCAQLRAA